MPFPILQFGTSRFLQAHFDYFVARGFVEGPGTGRIAVVQTTASADSARRVAFFDAGWGHDRRLVGFEGQAETAVPAAELELPEVEVA